MFECDLFVISLPFILYTDHYTASVREEDSRTQNTAVTVHRFTFLSRYTSVRCNSI